MSQSHSLSAAINRVACPNDIREEAAEQSTSLPPEATQHSDEPHDTRAASHASGHEPFLPKLALLLSALVACSPDNTSYAAPLENDATESAASIQLGNPSTERWQFGVIVHARGALVGATATLPLPMSWPEQEIMTVERQQSRSVRSVSIRELDHGVTQLVVSIPRLDAGGDASALVTLDIVKRDILAPSVTDSQRLPRGRKRDLLKFTKPSPYIDSKDPRIVESAQQAISNSAGGWQQAEAIYDWVRSHIEYRFDRNIKSARRALDDGYGDCEEMTSLFIAMCRAVDVPARAVWVPGHCYPEFYLEDSQSSGHWYPCQVAGSRSFGAMSETRPILQKGDSFRVPGMREPQRYVQQTFMAKSAAAAPQVTFVCKKLE